PAGRGGEKYLRRARSPPLPGIGRVGDERGGRGVRTRETAARISKPPSWTLRLLEVPHHIHQQMRRAAGHGAGHREAVASQSEDGVVGAGLAGAEVEDAGTGGEPAGWEDLEIAGLGGADHGDVHREGRGRGRNAAGAGDVEGAA